MPLQKLRMPAVSDTRPRQTSNDRDQGVLDGVDEANRPLQRLAAEERTDLFFDISVGIIDKKSEMFTWQLGQRHLRHLREASVA